MRRSLVRGKYIRFPVSDHDVGSGQSLDCPEIILRFFEEKVAYYGKLERFAVAVPSVEVGTGEIPSA